MAEVANGAYWQLADELFELIGDLHKRGELSKQAFDELTKAVGWGNRNASLEYLRQAGLVPSLPTAEGSLTRTPT